MNFDYEKAFIWALAVGCVCVIACAIASMGPKRSRPHRRDGAASRRSVPRAEEVFREPKSENNTCECFAGSSACGGRPAGAFMKPGWPDSLVLCERCEADAHTHECTPEEGHTDECKTRTASRETGRTCSKAPNVSNPPRAAFDFTALAPLARDVRAVRVLDAWVAKRGNHSWAVKRSRDKFYVRIQDGNDGCNLEPPHDTPALARIAAAQVLLNEDPELANV